MLLVAAVLAMVSSLCAQALKPIAAAARVMIAISFIVLSVSSFLKLVARGSFTQFCLNRTTQFRPRYRWEFESPAPCGCIRKPLSRDFFRIARRDALPLDNHPRSLVNTVK